MQLDLSIWKARYSIYPSFVNWFCPLAQKITTDYQILKDISFGFNEKQKLDLYLFKEAKSLIKNNYTMVFVPESGYYVSDKSEEWKDIEPYLKKAWMLLQWIIDKKSYATGYKIFVQRIKLNQSK